MNGGINWMDTKLTSRAQLVPESLAGFEPIPAGSPRAARTGTPIRPTASDEVLVGLAKQGDSHAFAALVVRYQRRVASQVARYVKRASDAEDVVQGVFIKAYLGINAFRGESAFYTWLYRIAKNSALNFVTRQRNVVVLEGDVFPEEGEGLGQLQGGGHDDPEELLCGKQLSENVHRAMTALDPDLARALNLYAVEGKKYQEIADILGVPIGTVRTRIFRARNFIARKLSPKFGIALR
jgi:RNA polymerase sigma-70 factor, ECF subfamily